MKRDTAKLRTDRYDLLVIGGGINGCAIARDASLRGAKTALIEKNDFACGASGKTTKLIHGGLRYLEQFNFKLVYEALRERAILLKTAPNLVKPIEFIIPVYKGDPRPLWEMKTGVFMYSLLAGKSNIKPYRALRKNWTLAVEPQLDPIGLKGSVLYSDAQTDDVRLCLDNAISAFQAGCSVANKIEVVGFIKEKGKIAGVEAVDKLTGENFSIHAKVVVNATGAWSNRILTMDQPGAAPITRPTKGIHIVYRKLPHERAILLSARKDKRIFFMIPWRGFTLIGTTDTDFSGSCDEVYATSNEVEYLLNEARRVFPSERIDKTGIITTFAGLRPLVNTQGLPAWKVTREHLIKESDAGLISVVGGKYTTYRHLAEQVVDQALSKMQGRSFKPCTTQVKAPTPAVSLPEKIDFQKRVEYAVKEEMANTLVDLLVRRLQLTTTASHGLDRLEECAHVMAELLGWSDDKKKSEMRHYEEEISKSLKF